MNVDSKTLTQITGIIVVSLILDSQTLKTTGFIVCSLILDSNTVKNQWFYCVFTGFGHNNSEQKHWCYYVFIYFGLKYIEQPLVLLCVLWFWTQQHWKIICFIMLSLILDSETLNNHCFYCVFIDAGIKNDENTVVLLCVHWCLTQQQWKTNGLIVFPLLFHSNTLNKPLVLWCFQ